MNGLTKLGFGFIEVGSVTPLPQPGNEKPRLFRLFKDGGIVNRYGFNSIGHTDVLQNLSKVPHDKSIIVGLNLGKNKTSQDAIGDYIKGLEVFKDSPNIDYFVVNISSPNTPGLRKLQNKETFECLLKIVLNYKSSNHIEKPLLIKISPDLSTKEIEAIAEVILKFRDQVNGIIISNTTTSRPKTMKSDVKLTSQTGGLSGVPLRDLSTVKIRQIYRLTKGQLPIVGVGGVFSGQDAYEKIKAGASLIQIYTALAYQGPPVVRKINRELAQLLKQDGYSNVKQAVGKEA